jgi:hypothetical protein
MRARVLSLVVAILATSIAPSGAMAKVLLSYTVGQGGTQPGVVSSLKFPIEYLSPSSVSLSGRIFTGFSFTTSDVGKTVTITPANDSNFNAFTSLLTDGISEDYVTFWFIPSPAQNESGQGWHEPMVAWGNDADPRIDLHGSTIASYSLTLNSLTVQNGPTTSTFNAQITFTASDSVPEPSSAMMLPVAAAGMIVRRRCHCRLLKSRPLGYDDLNRVRA